MLYDTTVQLLYKETDDKYSLDKTVDQDEIVFLCDELYRFEMLKVFGLIDGDMDKLTNKIELLYEEIKTCPELNCDNASTFMFMFSYESFYKIHPIICDFLNIKHKK